MKQHENKQLDELRHSAAHLLAAAVLRLWPQAKPAIGPATEDGFYYDFEFPEPVREHDLPKIEKMMRKTVEGWDGFERIEVSKEEAIEQFKDNPYKLELIEEHSQDGGQLTLYKSGSFTDLCRGGHIDDPRKKLKHFKLLSIAGAYWRGDEKNTMLTRIYGTAFPTQEELEEFLRIREEAKARDHKKLGRELDLFVFSELVGKGLPLWTPKGSTIRRELERFIVDEELKRGYLHVYTPDIAGIGLYKTSGHYPYYKDSMYAPIVIDNEEFMLRPMTCPHHFELYKSRPHSYRELPVRYAELAKLYRYEQSGELSGLQRVRTFCLADAHIIAKPDQAESEINGALDLIEYAARVMGLKANHDYWYRLSLGDRNDEKKYFKSDADWDNAEQILRDVLSKRAVKSYEAAGEAAFYGPKIDIQMKNVNGKEDTAFTVQYDFVMPKRFELRYIDEDGTEKEPIVIHRSSIGAIERVIAFLIERYAGAFPFWLAPVQTSVIPVADRHHELAEKVHSTLKSVRIRSELRNEQKSVSYKIRQSILQKIPYQIIIGDNELNASSEQDIFVTVRSRDGQDLGMQTLISLQEYFRAQLENTIQTELS
ncbi:MAG: threonine--tRNA ligase [Patescibacteria group bacterium]|nr:threonine--tRNA ligase [Patescibacteria group bacterium]